MAEPEKEQIGDGQDNFGQAAGKAIQAAQQISHEAAAAASKSAEAAANTAGAMVKASMEGGTAVAKVAAGTAAGGPWGAILSATWTTRHSLFKVLICICLFLLIIAILICSIPSIVLDSVFGLNGVPPAEGATLESSYAEMSDAVSTVIDAGYDHSLARVEEIILDGGYDYDLSMDALINAAHNFRWQAGFNGRSGGYLVLYQGDLKPSKYLSYCTSCGQRNYRSVSDTGNVCGACGKASRVDIRTPPKQPVTFPGRGTDMDDNYEEWSLSKLQDRVKLVQELDSLADDLVSQAVHMAKSFYVVEETYYVPRTQRVLVAK